MTSDALELRHWEILDLAPGEGSAEKLAHGGSGWVAATAPGDTYLALHRAGRIPHPLAGENEAACAWVREREWWWRASFAGGALAADERLLLQFEGLDTYAGVWLDGVPLGESDNMFTPLRFDISRHLRAAGRHVLLLRFTPPALAAAGKSMRVWPIADPIAETKRNFHRKAQFGWGWDWGPRLPTVGIWRPARLLRQRIAAIADLRFSTLALAPSARVEVALTLELFAPPGDQALVVALRLTDPDGACVAHAELAAGGAVARTELSIERPRLWWTPELGEAALYRLEAELRHDGGLLERRALQVGIRRIELDTSPDPDEPGCDFFRFVLNGVPLFARGSNWIPASSFVGAVTAADYAALLQSAVDANMNMIRVWGGGVYEDDAFYQACDILGLLVWQDFMFASANYPDHDEDFMASVRREVESQVLRLRNHPSLALWCGNNECQCAHALLDFMHKTQTPYEGTRIFEELIPQVLQRLDPAMPYRPGSPYGGGLHNGMRSGDVHNWTVWHGLPPVPDQEPAGEFVRTPTSTLYTRYAEDMARFVSEFGIQAAPARATLERWVAPDQLALDSPAFLNRIKDHPKDKINAMLLPVTGLPADLDQYVEYTQLVQAEGLKFGIEHYRRRKPHCSGTLMWQHNDCWPGISWSLVDFDGVRKAGWFYVARAYAPVMGSFRQLDGGAVELWVTNDRREALQVDAQLSMLGLHGGTLWSEPVCAMVPANAAAPIWRAEAQAVAAAPERVLVVRSAQFPANRLLFAPFKELPPAQREPEMRVQAMADGTLEVVLQGRGYHPFVHLLLREPGARFSDNYFDLHAGELRTIRVRAQRPLQADEVQLRRYHPRASAP